jgi:hypothetical protein
MYDDVLRVAVLDRLGELLRDLANHPGQAVLVAGGIALVLLWLTRK